MNRQSAMGLAFWMLLAIPLGGLAEMVDGSQPILCASVSIFECVDGGECKQATAAAVNAPQFLRIDFKRESIHTTRESGAKRLTDIEFMESVDNRLILQGVEDGLPEGQNGLGWSLSIVQETGKMTLTASGEQFALVIFGACTPL